MTFSRNAGWLAGVAGFTEAEQLSYLRLLCHQWLAGDAGLPPELPALRRLAGRGVTPALLAKFPASAHDGRLRNAKLELIRAEQRARIAKSRDKIEKMNAARGARRTSTRTPADALVEGLGDAPQEGSCRPPHLPPPTSHPEQKERDTRATATAIDADADADAAGSSFPSLHEVTAYAPTVMAPPECAEHFWNACEGVGWVTKHGQPISDWRPLFRNYATSWKANLHQRVSKGNPRPPPTRNDTANQPGRYK